MYQGALEDQVSAQGETELLLGIGEEKGIVTECRSFLCCKTQGRNGFLCLLLRIMVQPPSCNCQNSSFHSCFCKCCNLSKFRRGGSAKKGEKGKEKGKKVKESRLKARETGVLVNSLYNNTIIEEVQ